MNSMRLRFVLFFLALLPGAVSLLPGTAPMIHAQGNPHARVYPDSPVFRGYRGERERQEGRHDGLRRQINVFMLERDAANGDPLAQHELGVRLLTGNGIAADTTRSAEWMRRAAAQSLPPAMYNYALLLHNGWGVEWNPFAALRLFRAAAERGMPEAQHVTGVLFTDGLVLPQNWDSAWTWFSKAAAASWPPALRARAEMLRRGLVQLNPDSSLAGNTASSPAASKDNNGTEDANGEDNSGAEDNNGAGTAWAPVLLDFDRPTQTAELKTETLLEEVLSSTSFASADSAALRTLLTDTADVGALRSLTEMAEWGNPEAMAMQGRLLEEGRHVPRDRWLAAERYATAVFLESMRAPMLLQNLLRSGGLGNELSARAWNGDARAQYVWACLKALDVETRLAETQALELLERAAASGHVASLTQLGICHATGRWVKRNRAAARTYWAEATALGQREARLRLAAMDVLTSGQSASRQSETRHSAEDVLQAEPSPDIPGALAVLQQAMAQGSLLAEVALAGSYERGIRRSPDPGKAVSLYRDAAARGSVTAWNSLLRMHDDIRPSDGPKRPSP